MRRLRALALLILLLVLSGCALDVGPVHLGSSDKATPAPCKTKPGYVYDSLMNLGQTWDVKYTTSQENASSVAANITFTSSATNTVVVVDNLNLVVTAGGGLANVVEASVKATINHTVTKLVSLQVGASIQYTIPPKTWAYGNYGVKVQVVEGHLYTSKDSCDQVSWGRVVTYTPISSGWCIWTSHDTPCASVTADTYING